MGHGAAYSIMVILGPILLAGAIAWALFRNKQRSPREERHSEAATKRLYDEGTTENDQGPR